MTLRTLIASCALAAALLVPGTGRADDNADVGGVLARLMNTLRLETSLAVGDTLAQGGLGLWLPVDPARHVRWGLDAFELGFARGVDDVRYRRSPLLLGVRITLGGLGGH